MTTGSLIIHTDKEPVVIDFNVTDPDKPVTIEITSTEVKVHTKDEPEVTA